MPRLFPLLFPILAFSYHSLAAVPSDTPPVTFNINIAPVSLDIETCGTALFTYDVTPTLNTLQPVPLIVSVQSVDGSLSMVIDRSALLGQSPWSWKLVNVQAGQYRLSMSSPNPQQYVISGFSNPFVIRLGSTACLGAASQTTTSNSQSSATSTSSTVSLPPRPSTSPPTTSRPVPSHSSSSSRAAALPSNISTASHSSTGVKAGVSVAVIVVVLAGAGALYWFFLIRRRRSRRSPRLAGGYGPGYDGLGSRDEYDGKLTADPLGRSFAGVAPATRVANSSSRTGLDEKDASSVNAAGVENIFRLSYLPPTAPPQAALVVGRSASGSSTSGDGSGSLENVELETNTTTSVAVSQPPRRANRKPVPAYAGTQTKRSSTDRKQRNSANSLNNPSYQSSLNDLPLQPDQPAPNMLNHKSSFGEAKPMNHVLMPDLPLHQN